MKNLCPTHQRVLVFIDETATSTNMVRIRGRKVIVFQCPCGTDATSRSPRKPLRTIRKHGDPAEPAIKRYVIIGFDNAEKAKAWYESADMKQLNAYNEQHTKGRAFMVDAVTP